MATTRTIVATRTTRITITTRKATKACKPNSNKNVINLILHPKSSFGVRFFHNFKMTKKLPKLPDDHRILVPDGRGHTPHLTPLGCCGFKSQIDPIMSKQYVPARGLVGSE